MARDLVMRVGCASLGPSCCIAFGSLTGHLIVFAQVTLVELLAENYQDPGTTYSLLTILNFIYNGFVSRAPSVLIPRARNRSL